MTQQMAAVNAVGLPARLVLEGTVGHDDAGVYLDTPTGKFRLDPGDLLEVPALAVVA